MLLPNYAVLPKAKKQIQSVFCGGVYLKKTSLSLQAFSFRKNAQSHICETNADGMRHPLIFTEQSCIFFPSDKTQGEYAK